MGSKIAFCSRSINTPGHNLFECRHSFNPESVQLVIWSIFIFDPNKSVKLWLLVGFSIADMPQEMLFYGNSMGLIDSSHIFHRMNKSHDRLAFLPELLESGNDEATFFLSMCSEDFIDAIKIIRASFICQGDKITIPKQAQKQLLSSYVRTQAAILTDDQKWLDRISSEAGFQFVPTQLIFAARCASIRCFRFLSINGCQYSQAVCDAAMYGGNEEIIQMCLEHGASLRGPDVLSQCIAGHRNDVVEWLVEVHNVEITQRDLVCAFDSGNWQIFTSLYSRIPSGAALKLYDNVSRKIRRKADMRTLVWMILTDNIANEILSDVSTIMYCDDLDLIMKSGIDIYTMESVQFAASNECHCILKHLQDTGKIDTFDRSNLNALHYAITRHDLVAIRCLLEYGADVNVVDKDDGSIALTYAADINSLELVQCLVEHGADINASDKADGWPAIMYAAQRGYLDIVAYLVEHGANVNAANEDNLNALMVAAHRGRTEVVRYLAEHGADVNAADSDGWTALMYAAPHRDTSLIECLVAHGANAGAIAIDGWAAMVADIMAKSSPLLLNTDKMLR